MLDQERSKLSPFELKDELIKAAIETRPSEIQAELLKAARATKGKEMLDAGRGNPNFLTTIPRKGFFEWGNFAMKESERSFSYLGIGLGGLAKKEGIEGRLDNFLYDKTDEGAQFIKDAISYVRDQMGYDPEEFIYEITKAILGGDYPVPDRMLSLSEKIVKKYIRKELTGGQPFDRSFELFATEGGAAAMSYIFNTLEKNHLLNKGDCVAMGTPIFTPYLEIPELEEYSFVQVKAEAKSDNQWQYSSEDLDQLLDPKVKAFFLVNPSNPASVKMSDENLEHLKEIIKKRPDLIVLTDDVYATFADNFKSIFTVCPKNTILVYSFSKYFGATGWRLGLIATAEENIFDEKLKNHPKEIRKKLNKRYASVTSHPQYLKFIDRIVADSRTVSLNHVAGLATPAQVQMVFFCLFSLMDMRDIYKNSMKGLMRSRERSLYKYMGMASKEDENTVGYYDIVEIEKIAEKLYDKEFSQWVEKNINQESALFDLANDAGVVLLPATDFSASKGGFRVSLANLNKSDYTKIGQAISSLLKKYHLDFLEDKKKSGV
ncbi:MAG: bifunctional aspartate transaminase/aspartate 4-decarboxylase [Lactovum sp.]